MADTFSLRERLHHLCYTTPAWGPFPLTIPSQDALFCHRRAAARVVATAIDTTLPSPGSQTEADIRSLSSALLAAIDQARANAARSRLQLDDLRGVIGAAATATEPALPTSALEALQAVLAARFSHLSSQLDRAEEVKTVTYERSLVAADGALETVTAELESVKIALSSLEPCELETQAAALVKRVEELHLLTSALPSAPPVTPMLAIALLPGELEALLDHFDALSSAYRDHEGAEEYLSLVNESLHSFGSIADGVVDASNIKVAIKGGSHRRRVLPGSTLELRATSSMSDPRASCPASIEAVADTLSRALKVSVRLATTATENVQRIVPFVSSNASDAAVSMTIAVPTDTPFDSLLSIDNIAIAMSGVDVPLELLDASLPLTFVVTRYVGIASMPTLTGMHSDNLVTPGVAEDGRLFMPQRKGVVTVYDGEGCAIESIEPELLCGRSSISETRACAFDDSASILFVASQTSVVALSGSTLSWNELWSRRGLDIVGGLAALPRHGLLAFTELNKNTLFLVRSSDGAEMTRVTGCNWISYVAYDPLHGMGCRVEVDSAGVTSLLLQTRSSRRPTSMVGG